MAYIDINLNILTGQVLHGAIGGLYALNEYNTPDVRILKALHPQIVAQKVPDGLQHPGGDTFKVIRTFKQAGGKYVHVYMQDIYPLWPYDNVALEDYYEKINQIIEKFKSFKDKESIVLIPFNEPDAIWFANKFDQFLRAWGHVYKIIKCQLPTIKIGGPNLANYNVFLMEEFISYCKSHNCIPDVITWHELNDSFFVNWEENLKTYKQIEKKLGIPEKEIVINEYGRPIDLGVPGSLVRWIAKLEKSKIYGCLAFWHVAGNFDDLVVENNKPNGAWWVYKWYAEMQGNTVQVDILNDYECECVATFDGEKRQIRALIGGTNKDINLRIKGLKKYTNLFGDKVKIKLYSTDWSGQQGKLLCPDMVGDGVTNVINGEVKIKILKPFSAQAYYLLVYPYNGREELNNIDEKEFVFDNSMRDCTLYEAEEIDTSGQLEKDPNYYCSGNWRVLLTQESYLRFTCPSSNAGKGKMQIYYSTHSNEFGTILLDTNGNKEKLLISPTISKGYVNIESVKVDLKEGDNTITLTNISKTNISIDCIKICRVGEEKKDNIVRLDLVREAIVKSGAPEFIYVNGSVAIKMKPKDSIYFDISVDKTGYHEIEINNQGVESDEIRKCLKNLKVYVNDIPLTEKFRINKSGIFLEEGINRIEFKYLCCNNSIEELMIENIQLKRKENCEKYIHCYEAEKRIYTTIQVLNESNINNQDRDKVEATEGSYWILNNVGVEEDGYYRLIIYYSNNIKEGTHPYNTKIVDVSAEVRINEDNKYFTTFRYTGNDKLFYHQGIDVFLQKGTNVIEILTNRNIFIDKVKVAPLEIFD